MIGEIGAGWRVLERSSAADGSVQSRGECPVRSPYKGTAGLHARGRVMEQ